MMEGGWMGLWGNLGHVRTVARFSFRGFFLYFCGLFCEAVMCVLWSCSNHLATLLPFLGLGTAMEGAVVYIRWRSRRCQLRVCTIGSGVDISKMPGVSSSRTAFVAVEMFKNPIFVSYHSINWLDRVREKQSSSFIHLLESAN